MALLLNNLKLSEDRVNSYLRYTSRPKIVKIHGISYSKEAVVRVKCPPGFACKEPFLYVQLSSIYVYDDNNVFCGNVISIEEVVEHTRCYRVSCDTTVWIGSYLDFYWHGVLHLKKKNGLSYIIEKDHLFSI